MDMNKLKNISAKIFLKNIKNYIFTKKLSNLNNLIKFKWCTFL